MMFVYICFGLVGEWYFINYEMFQKTYIKNFYRPKCNILLIYLVLVHKNRIAWNSRLQSQTSCNYIRRPQLNLLLMAVLFIYRPKIAYQAKRLPAHSWNGPGYYSKAGISKNKRLLTDNVTIAF